MLVASAYLRRCGTRVYANERSRVDESARLARSALLALVRVRPIISGADIDARSCWNTDARYAAQLGGNLVATCTGAKIDILNAFSIVSWDCHVRQKSSGIVNLSSEYDFSIAKRVPINRSVCSETFSS